MAAGPSLTRDQYLEEVRCLAATATELTGRYNLTQLTWQPRGGEGWSMLECLDHLSISTSGYLDAMEKTVGNARPGKRDGIFVAAGLPSAAFIRSLEPPPRRRIPAPAKIRPRATLQPEGIMPVFLKTMDRVSAMVVSTNGRDLNATRFPNPFIPLLRFTIGSGFLIIAAHGRRHLWQATQVAIQSGFPC